MAAKLNRLAAGLALAVLTAAFGLQLAAVTWSVLAPQTHAGAGPGAGPEAAPAAGAPQRVSVDTVLASLARHNPWETEAAPPPPEPEPEPAAEQVVATALNLTLIGTMVLPDNRSWAILTRKRANEQLTVQVGDEVDGAFVERIERNAVYLRNGERLEVLSMVLAGIGSGGAPAASAAPRPTTEYRITRERYESLLAEGPMLLKKVSFVPYYQGRDTVGYQLNFNAQTTELSQFGISNGDVIQKVNGIPVTETNKLLSMIRDMRAQSELQIDLLKNGTPQTIQVQVQG